MDNVNHINSSSYFLNLARDNTTARTIVPMSQKNLELLKKLATEKEKLVGVSVMGSGVELLDNP